MVRIDLTASSIKATVLTIFVLLAVGGARYASRADSGHITHTGPSGLISGSLVPQPPDKHRETGPFVDGAATPHLIPDDVAYSHFLRMLMTTEATDQARIRQKAYINHVLRTADAAALRLDQQPSDADVAAVLRFIASYDTRLRTFDASRGPGSLAEARRLALEIASKMPTELGEALAADVDRYVQQVFKRKVKIIL